MFPWYPYLLCFNPRTRTGCDAIPAWKCWAIPCFNPRTRTGCDDSGNVQPAVTGGFNPRTRTGCDRTEPILLQTPWGFNPRTRTGCDHYCTSHLLRQVVSIHAPARGATVPRGHGKTILCFNPRTRTGCDSLADVYMRRAEFQSTHPHGVRLNHPGQLTILQVSIHAPARGATQR